MTRPARPPRGGEFPTAPRPWLTSGQVARRLHVARGTVARWADQGRLEYRRTPGGHRRYDPELIDQLVSDLTDHP